jgi:hypothetical protein
MDSRVPSLAPPAENRIPFIPAKAAIQDEVGPRFRGDERIACIIPRR